MDAVLVAATGVVGGLVGWRLSVAAAGLRLWASLAWAVILMSIEGVVLAEAGVFTPASWLAATLVVGVVAASLAQRRADTPGPSATARPALAGRRDASATRVVLAGAALAVLVALAQGPPMDVRLDGRDPGVYALTAARLDHTGSLDYRDQVVRDLAPGVRDGFFPPSGPEQLSTARSMGFYLADAESGRVVPQFLPLAPVWMTVGRWFAGADGATAAGLAALWLTALSLWALGVRLAGPVAGWVAGILVAVNFGAGWFARRGAAEPFAMALVAIAAVAIVESERSGDASLAALGGLALGLTWLAKLEMALLAVPLAVLYVHDLASGRFRRKASWAFWGAAALAGVHFLVHAWFWSRPYVHDVLLVPGTDLATVTALAAAALLVAVVGAFLVAARGYPESVRLRRLTRPADGGLALRGIVAALVLVGLAWGAWVRPTNPSWDSHNVIELAWLISPWVLALAAAGLVWILLDRGTPSGAGRILVLLLPVAATILYRKQIIPHLLWAYRRHLPVILPLAAIAAGCAVAGLLALAWRWLRRRDSPVRVGLATVIAAVALAALALGLWEAWGEVRFYGGINELEGSDRLIEQLRDVVPPDALVLVEPRTRRGLLRFEGALQHELQRDVLRLRSPDLNRPDSWEVILTQSRRQRPVFLLTSGYVVADPELGAARVRELALSTTRLLDTDRALPTRLEDLELRARLYRLSPDADLAPLEGELDLGEWDDLYLDGPTMYEVEAQAERRYRWTRPVGRVFLPGLEPEAELLLITMAGGYPPDRGTQELTVRLDGREIGTVALRRGWRSYAFDLPADVPVGRLPVLELEVEPPWRPEAILDSEDPRTVGVAVDLVRWGAKPS